MKALRPAASHLADLEPYDPKYLPARIYLNANENPFGLPESVRQEILSQLECGLEYHRYPDPLAKKLRAQLADELGIDEECILLGNGGDELLFNLMLAYGGPGRSLLTTPPTFSVYASDAQISGTRLVEVGRTADGKIDEAAVLARVAEGDIDLVMIASPNNPTGECVRTDFLLELLDVSDALILIDQAYVEFAASEHDMRHYLSEHRNLAVLRSFSKAYSLAGIRLGYVLADPEAIQQLLKVRQPYSVDRFSALVGSASLSAKIEIQEAVTSMIAQRQRVSLALATLPDVQVYPSDANFLLFRVTGAHAIWQHLYDDYNILLRDFSTASGLHDCLRVSMGTPQEMDEFLEALTALMREDR